MPQKLGGRIIYKWGLNSNCLINIFIVQHFLIYCFKFPTNLKYHFHLNKKKSFSKTFELWQVGYGPFLILTCKE